MPVRAAAVPNGLAEDLPVHHRVIVDVGISRRDEPRPVAGHLVVQRQILAGESMHRKLARRVHALPNRMLPSTPCVTRSSATSSISYSYE